MRVKFYKGPYHGKVREIDPHHSRWGIRIAKPERMRFDPNNYDHAYTSRQGRYEMQMMTTIIDGINYTAPAMHPDGSIFYVWKGYDK